MAVGAAGVACAGNCFPVSAFAVLAYQKPCIFSIDAQHTFPASGTFGVGQIVMTEGTVGTFNLLDQFSGIGLDFLNKYRFLVGAFGNVGKFHLPFCGEFRFFQVFRYKGQKLPAL